MSDQLQIPLGLATCGYCGTPMAGRECDPCAPELARISTTSQWQEFMTRKLLRRKPR